MSTESPSIEIVYIGGPTVLLVIEGFKIMIDPTFDPPGGEYGTGPVVLKKNMGPAIPLHEVKTQDLILLSHDQHADNLDRAGKGLLPKAPHVLTTVSGAARLGGNAVGFKPWDFKLFKTQAGNHLRITATPARHGPAGIEKIVGDVVGFMITLEESKIDLVYMTGDTVWYSGTAEVAKRFRPEFILLFAGAAQTRGPFHLTMNTNDAIETAVEFPKAKIIPVHCEGWAHFTQSRTDLVNAYSALGLAHRLILPVPGELTRVSPEA